VRARSISDAILKRAWYSPAPACLISAKLGICPKNLQRRWRRMKYEGKIPINGERPVTKTWRNNHPSSGVLLLGEGLLGEGSDYHVNRTVSESNPLVEITEEFLRRLREAHRIEDVVELRLRR